jgi:hypothetical protein
MGYLGRAIGRRITKKLDDFAQTPEGQAALARNERKMAMAKTAREIAGAGGDDEATRAQLREQFSDDLEPVRDAIEHLAALRTSYLDDRAYRLLTAAVSDTPVRPIDPAVRDQFEAEARLGRMSLNDAFTYLVSLEPRLGDLPAQRQAQPPQKRRRWRDDPEARLVGAWTDSQHPIINTDLARTVVLEYLGVTRNGRMPTDDPTPFFERRRRAFTGSFALFGKGDTRPRATN